MKLFLMKICGLVFSIDNDDDDVEEPVGLMILWRMLHKLTYFVFSHRILYVCPQWWMCFVRRKFMDKSLSGPGQWSQLAVRLALVHRSFVRLNITSVAMSAFFVAMGARRLMHFQYCSVDLQLARW